MFKDRQGHAGMPLCGTNQPRQQNRAPHCSRQKRPYRYRPSCDHLMLERWNFFRRDPVPKICTQPGVQAVNRLLAFGRRHDNLACGRQPRPNHVWDMQIIVPKPCNKGLQRHPRAQFHQANRSR